MTPAALAALLNGREYGVEVLPGEGELAKAAGLVIVYGYSDDNMEFTGAIDDEVGCYGGGVAYLSGEGLLQNKCDNDDCPNYADIRANALTIEAVWCEDNSGPAWTFKTDIPHATFDIFEDGELFCRGIVFALADVGKADADAGRAAFEAFILSQPFYAITDVDELREQHERLDRDLDDDGYLDACVHGAWLAWNARSATAPATTTWRDRLAAERDDLDARLLKLREFLRTDACMALPFDDRALLSRQERLMDELSEVLAERAKRAGVAS